MGYCASRLVYFVGGPLQMGRSALHCAATVDNVAVVNTLVKHGANVNIQNQVWDCSPPLPLCACVSWQMPWRVGLALGESTFD